MNWVDLVIILILVVDVIMGLKTGLLELALTFGGLSLGLLAGSRLAQLAAAHMSSPFAKFMAIIIIELGLAASLWLAGMKLSRHLEPRPARFRISKIDEISGAAIEVLAILALSWLIASGLSNIRDYGIGSGVRDSFIIQKLNNLLPPPDVLSQLEKIVSPNSFPSVFLGLEPSHTTISPKNRVDNQAVLADEASVVKIRGLGCGQEVFGSGFVVAKNLVMTNAHVVAGLKRPVVVDSDKSYQSKPVFFDPDLDIAILRVDNLADAPLKISSAVLPEASAVTVLGFPGGGYLEAQDAVIIDRTTAVGRNIYNEGLVRRDVYEVQVVLHPGNSGGPLVAPDGSVAGLVFGKAISQDNIGYALLIKQAQPIIERSKTLKDTADTGFCS